MGDNQDLENWKVNLHCGVLGVGRKYLECGVCSIMMVCSKRQRASMKEFKIIDLCVFI
jgi:hypothetical protein